MEDELAEQSEIQLNFMAKRINKGFEVKRDKGRVAPRNSSKTHRRDAETQNKSRE